MLATCLCLPVSAVLADAGPTTSAALETRLTALQERAGFPGLAVAVVDGEGVRYQKGFGWADRDAKTPFSDKTVLNIGSVSKTFVGIAIMQAAEQGRLDLDAPIDGHLPFKVRHPRFPDEPVSLRMLATHTSGIRDRESVYRQAYTQGVEPSMALGDYLKEVFDPAGKWFDSKNFGKQRPGAAIEYSNIGAALAAYVVERAMGEPFDALTRRTILQPLGMDDSGWSYGAVDRTRHATLYENGKPLDPYTLVTYPDGGLRSSVSSLGRYVQALLGAGRLGDARILQASSFAAMIAPQYDVGRPPKGFKGKNSGVFWALDEKGLIGHTGGDPGITAVLAFDPVARRGWVFIANRELDEKTAESFREIWSLVKSSAF